ncbi:hypothetical protein [Aquimarina mytili]|uniref:Lipoprotein n=1 Tax=Aquimarina mytili TaxID=874423 RepID=A0A936ZX68_9FLAO|nr:hypothetical protein [Aquimarina mytili]MBL0683901.1 hypothetical protein [Aquimarina mytili]
MKPRSFYISILTICIVAVFSGCYSPKNRSNSKLSKSFTRDTIQVGYTYWWPHSGPFIGICGDRYALVFTGEINKINKPKKESHLLVSSHKMIIEIEEILTVRNLEKNKYQQQQLLSSNCCENLDLEEGDNVIVFCYEYSGGYSIPGQNSILKIEDSNTAIVKSIKKYIKADQNPLVLKDDIVLWKQYGFEKDLTRIIACKQEIKK